MSAVPLTREERDRHRLFASRVWERRATRRDQSEARLIDRYEATVQAVEAERDEVRKRHDEVVEAHLRTEAERDALARRVEALRAAHEQIAEEGLPWARILSQAALDADDEAARPPRPPVEPRYDRPIR
jgi:DNA-binding protein H-NS